MDSQKFLNHLKTEYACTVSDFGIEFGKPIRLHNNRKRTLKTNRQITDQSIKLPLSLEKQNRLTINEKFPRFTSQQSSPHFDKTGIIFPKIKNQNMKRQEQNRIERVKSERSVEQAPALMIGSYRVGGQIGKGSYGSVRIARSWKGNVYAIKIYEKTALKDQFKYKNVLSEIEILSSINHPNLLHFIESVQTAQNVSIITELLDNTSLIEWIKLQPRKVISQDKIKKILKSILEGLQYLHEKNYAHRDLKMENILINKDLQIKIIDFGFAIKDDTFHNDFCGTPHYISPQIISKGGYQGKPADIWAVGIIFYKLITGDFPYKGITNKALYRKICNGSINYPIEIPYEAKELIEQMLHVDASFRPTAKQLLKHPYFSE